MRPLRTVLILAGAGSVAAYGWFPLINTLDLTLGARSGLELLKQVKSEFPRLPVLILSMHAEDQYAVRAIRAGAGGYLTKEAATEKNDALGQVGVDVAR